MMTGSDRIFAVGILSLILWVGVLTIARVIYFIRDGGIL